MRQRPIHKLTATIICAALPLLGGTTLAHAGEWSGMIGAGVALSPEYDGAKNYDVKPVPNISLEWENTPSGTDAMGGIFAAPETGFGLYGASLDPLKGLQVEFFNTPVGTQDLSASIGVGYNMGRDQNDSDALRGMGDINGYAQTSLTFETSPSADIPNFITSSLSIVQDVGGSVDGTTVEIEAAMNHMLAPGVVISYGPHATWANEDHMQSYFGVSAKQSARSGYRTYNADSGFKNVGVGVSFMFPLSERWMVTGLINYDRLLGDAADSPLVQDKGSADQGTAVIGTSYRF